jgi:hypothetical protein
VPARVDLACPPHDPRANDALPSVRSQLFSLGLPQRLILFALLFVAEWGPLLVLFTKLAAPACYYR